MSRYELLLSAEAERCIEDQLQWYEADQTADAAALANRWLGLMEVALDSLRQHLERQSSAPENGRWVPEISLRQMRFKPWKTPSAWRILFVIDEETQRVTVLQVRGERRPFLDNDAR